MNDEVVKILNRIESDLIGDRSKIDQIIVQNDTIISMQKQLYDRLPRTENKTRDRMQEVTQPVIEAVDKLTTQIEKKKQVYIKRSFSLSGLFNRKAII